MNKKIRKALIIAMFALLLAIVSHCVYGFYQMTRGDSEYVFSAVISMFGIGAIPVGVALWGSKIKW